MAPWFELIFCMEATQAIKVFIPWQFRQTCAYLRFIDFLILIQGQINKWDLQQNLAVWSATVQDASHSIPFPLNTPQFSVISHLCTTDSILWTQQSVDIFSPHRALLGGGPPLRVTPPTCRICTSANFKFPLMPSYYKWIMSFQLFKDHSLFLV